MRSFQLAAWFVLLLSSWSLPALCAAPPPEHPLDPLTADEIVTAVQVIRADSRFPPGAFFPILTLNEPPKEGVMRFRPGTPFRREAFIVVFDRDHNRTTEVVVSVRDRKIVSLLQVPGVQPAFLLEELNSAPQIVRRDPRWQAAMRKRGITDFDAVQIDAWAPGTLGLERFAAESPRLIRALAFYKGNGQNIYSRPIEGVVAVVNMNTQKVIDVLDTGVVPVAKDEGGFDEASVKASEGALRPPLKPLRLVQSLGPEFSVHGHEVRWQKWRFRFAMHPREGLVLYTVGYEDKGRVRSVLYRASLSEMMVPYGDPDQAWSWRSAFDVGEYGVGRFVSPLEPGRDAPDNALFFDAPFVDDFGKSYTLPRAVALYERDGGLLWKHFNMEKNQNESRRARQLVISFVATVGNYDYGINWIFGQDGGIEMQADLTGIMLAKGVKEADPHFGHVVSRGVVAPHHQHFFNFRLDLDVDGTGNTVTEMNARPLPEGPQNPHGNAFVMEQKSLLREKDGQRDVSLAESRKWVVQNPSIKNALGQPVGYALLPRENSVVYALPNSQVRKRAAFLNHHLYITRYKPAEMHAAGYYPNQSAGGDGVEKWIVDDESIDNKDVVLWYTVGTTHIPRPEEWPVMPATQVGFKLVPVSFFAKNPALDVPREPRPDRSEGQPAAQPHK